MVKKDDVDTQVKLGRLSEDEGREDCLPVPATLRARNSGLASVEARRFDRRRSDAQRRASLTIDACWWAAEP